jgi:hypothetical protein
MKRSRFFKVLGAAVVLALLMLAIPLTPALGAVGTIDITVPATNTGPPGTGVTLTCTGFTQGQSYTVSFGGTVVTSGTTGASPFTTGFTVPARPRGPYTVAISVTGDTSNTETFTITPGISLNVSSGHVGDTLTVEGDGFDASDTVTIWYDTTNVGTKTTDTYGSFTSDFSFVVPASTKGSHDIRGQYDTSYSNTVTFTVSPEITLNPTLGAVDDEIIVTGTGFDDYSNITLYFDNVAQTISGGDDDTSSKGSFECTFYVPEASRGSHTVKVQDQVPNYDTATFTVSASITIDPTTGPSGTVVTVTGTGFRSSHAITVSYDDVNITADITGDDATDADGSFEFTFVVPPGDAGTYEVKVSDGTNTVTADFQSTTSATISQTTTSTAPGNVGMELSITGIGFSPDDTVTVTYLPENEDLATAATNAQGNFTVDFTIPASEGGEHTITVSDGTVSMTFDFFMEENPPPVPELVSPLAGEKADALAIFDWETVHDVTPRSEPVTYDLQVATSENFSLATLLVEETGLTTSTYTLPDLDKLESTDEDAPYYWRVRAVDAASNASAWSEAETFVVGWSFSFTGWVVWVTMAVVAIVFLFIGLWIGRRTGGGGDYF